jgi:hypothetical protein
MRGKVLIPRRSERKRVMLPTRCRMPAGIVYDVVISDLTAEGCCMSTHKMKLNPGQWVKVRPEGIERHFLGEVRWSSETQAGIEFDYPIYGPVAEHLQHKHALIR